MGGNERERKRGRERESARARDRLPVTHMYIQIYIHICKSRRGSAREGRRWRRRVRKAERETGMRKGTK